MSTHALRPDTGSQTAASTYATSGFVSQTRNSDDGNPRAERNRANAAHSTGPRTAEGKAASSSNSFKHGLSTTKHVIYCHENPALFAQLHEELIEIYAPQSPRESLAIADIAECRWALRRFDEAETALLDQQFHRSTDPDLPDDSRNTLPESMAFCCTPIDEGEPTPPEIPSFDLLYRYRRHWDRRHNAALAELDRAQRARRQDAREQRQQAEEQRKQELHELKVALMTQKLLRKQKPQKETPQDDALLQSLERYLNATPPGFDDLLANQFGFVPSDEPFDGITQPETTFERDLTEV